MSRQRRLSDGQRNLKELLEKKQQIPQNITTTEILSATGWKRSTLATYLKKGYLSSLLVKVGTEEYRVVGAAGMSDSEFLSTITQTKTLREVGAFCRHRLAQELVKKSRQNMMLALELINRPSSENRLDGFVIMSITAWEQLLKAYLIEEHGENVIFRPMRSGKRRETIGFRECLERTFEQYDPVRRNLERIQFLRDQAVHLLMPEAATVLTGLFQAGVFNYAKFYRDLCGASFLPASSIGVLALLGDPRPPTIVHLSAEYGPEIAREILELCQAIEHEIGEIDDPRYSIPVDYRLVFAKSDTVGGISLSKAADLGLEALVVTKPVDHEKSHPYLTTDAAGEIDRRLSEQLTDEERMRRLQKANSDDVRFTRYDFLAIVYKEKWRNASQNRYYYRTSRPVVHRYSEEALTFVIDKISTDPDYLHRARKQYQWDLKKKVGKRRN